MNNDLSKHNWSLSESYSVIQKVFMIFLCVWSHQYHIGKVSLTEQFVASSPAMDDLDSALQCLEVKMEGESSADDMLVSFMTHTHAFNNREQAYI